MRISLLIIIFLLSWALPAFADGGNLSIGEFLTYKRGTARAKEELLEFPYYHRKRMNKECWASVVRQGRGALLICKAAEAHGEKDRTGQLANQEFKPEHPFMKTLDMIKEDAYNNLRKELKSQNPLDEKGWKIFHDGSAVHKIFYRDRNRNVFGFLSVKQPGREVLSPAIPVKFLRTPQGVLMSAHSGGGWSPPQPMDPVRNASAQRVFMYLEKRQGF